MKVLDFLCLDGMKALIKVPICALMNLDNSSKLDQVLSLQELNDIPTVRKLVLPATPFVNKPSPKINAKWLNNNNSIFSQSQISQKSDSIKISFNHSS